MLRETKTQQWVNLRICVSLFEVGVAGSDAAKISNLWRNIMKYFLKWFNGKSWPSYSQHLECQDVGICCLLNKSWLNTLATSWQQIEERELGLTTGGKMGAERAKRRVNRNSFPDSQREEGGRRGALFMETFQWARSKRCEEFAIGKHDTTR